MLRHLLSVIAVVAAMLPAQPVHANVVTDNLGLAYPDLGISLPVFEGSVDPSGTIPVPYQPVAAWHHPATAWPGQGSRTVLFAHDQPGYFANLVYAQPGQRIYIHRSDGRVIGYTVTSNQLIASTDYSWLQPNGFDQLVLLTCTSWSSSDPRRIVVATADFVPPSPPENLSTESGANWARAYWSKPNFSGYDGPTSYTVWAQPGNHSYTVPGWYSGAGVGGLTPGVQYSIWVTANNSAGSSGGAYAGTATPFPALQLTPTAASLVAGTPTTINISAVDSNNALVTNYTGPVAISSTDPQAVLPAPITLVGGAGSFPVTLKTAGSQTVTATDTHLSAMFGSASITVAPAAMAGFHLSLPSLIPEGQAATVSVSSIDAYGNVQPAYSGTVHLSANPTANAASIGGDHSFVPGDAGTASISVVPAAGATGAWLGLHAADTVNSALKGDGGTGVGYTYFFTWFDRISSPGFKGDYIHVINPNATPVNARVDIPAGYTGPCPTQWRSLQPGEEWVVSCDNGFGGPVTVVGSQPVQASQRVQYFDTFNEVTAQAYSDAGTNLVFSWFDRISDPGFVGDNIHVTNPGSQTATVTVHIPGGNSCPDTTLPIPPGQGRIFSCAQGFGGPVTVTSNLKVLASQRVQYYQSFNEVTAQDTSHAAQSLEFTWFDRISDPGFFADNVHVINPGAPTSTAHVTVSIPGCGPQQAALTGGKVGMFTCSSGFGGPVTVSSDLGVIASQRVQFYRSFNEVAAMDTTKGTLGTTRFTWFDRISSPGFRSDNVHVLNPSGTTANVTVNIPGCGPQPAAILAGHYQMFSCDSGFGGPVTITSDQKILASQRVQYYQSFNEVAAGPLGT